MNFEKNTHYIDNDINNEMKIRSEAIRYIDDLKKQLTQKGLDEKIEEKDEERREILKQLITYKTSLTEREENERIITRIETLINYLKERMVNTIKKDDEENETNSITKEAA